MDNGWVSEPPEFGWLFMISILMVDHWVWDGIASMTCQQWTNRGWVVIYDGHASGGWPVIESVVSSVCCQWSMRLGGSHLVTIQL